MKMKTHKEFPAHTINNRPFAVYPRKGYVCVDGYRYFDLKELKKINLNTRLSFRHDLFAAINKA